MPPPTPTAAAPRRWGSRTAPRSTWRPAVRGLGSGGGRGEGRGGHAAGARGRDLVPHRGCHARAARRRCRPSAVESCAELQQRARISFTRRCSSAPVGGRPTPRGAPRLTPTADVARDATPLHAPSPPPHTLACPTAPFSRGGVAGHLARAHAAQLLRAGPHRGGPQQAAGAARGAVGRAQGGVEGARPPLHMAAPRAASRCLWPPAAPPLDASLPSASGHPKTTPSPTPPHQALYDCYCRLGPALGHEALQLLCWQMITVRSPPALRSSRAPGGARRAACACTCTKASQPEQPCKRWHHTTPPLPPQVMSEHAAKEELVLYPAMR